MQAITTIYRGPTNIRGSRITAKCAAKTIHVHYAPELNFEGNHRAAAIKLASMLNWHDGKTDLVTGCDHKGDYVHVFSFGLRALRDMMRQRLNGEDLRGNPHIMHKKQIVAIEYDMMRAPDSTTAATV